MRLFLKLKTAVSAYSIVFLSSCACLSVLVPLSSQDIEPITIRIYSVVQTSKAGSVKALLVFFYMSRGWQLGFSRVSKATDATMDFYKEAIAASVYVWELVMLARHSSWRGRCGGGSPRWLAQVLCQGRYLRSRPDQRNRWRAEGALQGASRGYRYTAS